MATVKDSDGPFEADISAFVDSKGNPTTDADVPVWAASGQDGSGNDLVALSPTADGDAQKQVVTLNGGVGQAQVTATFGDPANGGFVVTGVLDIQPGAAVSATMTFAGPGL